MSQGFTINTIANQIIPGKNLIIGGDLGRNPWQRGTSFVSPTDVNTADRMLWGSTGTGAVTIQKTADSPSVLNAGYYSNSCLEVVVTTADTSIAATEFYNLVYVVEGYDYAAVAQQPLTLSFWVKSSVTGIYGVGFRNVDSTAWCIMQYTINAANTWQKVVINLPAPPATGNWNYTNGYGLILAFGLAIGSNYASSTIGSWSTGGGTTLGSANQVNFMATLNNSFRINLIQLELGSQASTFEVVPQALVLAKCQRYYQTSYPTGTKPGTISTAGVRNIITCAAYGAGTNMASDNFGVTMRTTPTVTIYTGQTGVAGNYYNVSAGQNAPCSVGGVGDNSYVIVTTNSVPITQILQWHYAAEADFN